MTVLELDDARLEAFGEQMAGVINSGLLALSISIGHQTGLFDTLADLPPSTTDEIAGAAGLHERYVREVLGALVTGGVIDYDPTTATYALPPEHAAFTTRAAGPNNLAALTQFVGMLGGVEQDVVRSFREGGGVPYERYPTFHRLMAELTRDTVDATLLDGTLDLLPGIRPKLVAGIDVADIACGSGYVSNVLARAFPNSRFVGYDLAEEAITAARAQAAEWGLDNVSFEVRDVTDLDLVDAFDVITTFDAVHDQAAPAEVLQGIARALRPDGTYLCVDVAASSHLHENIEHPLGPAIYTISTMHCMTVSLAAGGVGLGAAWGEQTARQMLADAGFSSVETHHVEGNPFNVYYVARPA
jgi:SAM-dependent methyltransferase